MSPKSTRQLPDHLAERADLLVVQPAGRLVEQEQARRRDERAGELDPLQRPEREPRGGPAGDVRDADVLDHLVRAGAGGALGAGAEAAVRADEHVLEHRHRLEELDVLEGAGDPALDDLERRRLQQALALEAEVALVRPVQAR